MSETMMSRVGRIISGSANAVIDAVEGATPEVVMTQSIREVEQAISDVRGELGKVIANKHLASQRLVEKNSKHEALNSKIECAISEKRDDLAEAAIAKQLDIEVQLPVLEQTISDSNARQKELEDLVEALQARKREMNEELKLFRQSKNSGDASSLAGTGKVAVEQTVNKKVDKATSTFERIYERKTGLAGLERDDLSQNAKLQELESLHRQNRIKERLAQVKSYSEEQA